MIELNSVPFYFLVLRCLMLYPFIILNGVSREDTLAKPQARKLINIWWHWLSTSDFHIWISMRRREIAYELWSLVSSSYIQGYENTQKFSEYINARVHILPSDSLNLTNVNLLLSSRVIVLPETNNISPWLTLKKSEK